jgi:hypothetical protein
MAGSGFCLLNNSSGLESVLAPDLRKEINIGVEFIRRIVINIGGLAALWTIRRVGPSLN